MKLLSFKYLALAITVLVVATIPGYAQVSSGTVLGVINDASGAVIPGVTVTVTNEGTNQSRQGVTNETGNYRVEPLQAGTYTVSAELPGFRREIRNKVTVDVGARVRLDFMLQVGDVGTAVEVTTGVLLVQSDDSQVGAVMDQRKIVELPLNGRNFSQLAYLTPGTFSPRAGSSLSDRGGFVVAGMAEGNNQFLVDGVNNNGAGTMESGYKVNVDEVSEFKVQTQNYNAQYGRYAGAQVDAVLKSGTNQFHGGAFGFARNDKFDARNFFDPSNKPQFKRNQYGGTLGGPIVRNKVFFFLGFQGQRQDFFRTGNPSVPFPEYWTGNLSRIPTVIRDPLTGNPFPNNQIPQNRLDPTALKFQPFWFGVVPDRNSLTRNATTFIADPENFWQQDVKINWQMNDNHQLVASWGLWDDDQQDWRHAGMSEIPNYNYYSKLKNQRLSFQETWTVSTSMINEFRTGISRVGRIHREPWLHDKDYARDVFGIVGTVGDVDPIGNGVPRLSITGYNSLSTAGSQPRIDGNWSIADTLAIQTGNHAIKFGADVFRQYMNLVVLSNQSGSFTFNGAGSGDPFADFLLGLPDTTARAFPLGPLSQHPNKYSYNAFVQDDWKASRNFTLSYGLRWELTTPMREKWGRLATFDPSLGGGKGGIRLPAIGVDGGKRYDDSVARFKTYYPTAIIERSGPFYKTNKAFAPRFGFAWTPGGKTSTAVRGGYGIFYQIDPLTPTGFYNLAPYMLTQNFTRADRPSFQNPWPGIGLAGTINVVGVEPNYQNEWSQQWNLDVQREVPFGVIIDMAYVGKRGTHIGTSDRDINQPVNGVKPYPLFGPVSYQEARGKSIYHGLQSRIEKRTDAGLNILVSYAWSKLLDDVGTVRDSYNIRQEWGPGTEDARHRLMTSFVYALPIGAGKPFLSGLGRLGNALVGGFEFSGIVHVNSGSPATPTLSTDNSGLGRRQDRPDIVGNWQLDKPNPTTGWWNKTAFVIPPRGSVGNAGKGSLVGPGYNGTDVSLLKRLAVGENKTLQIRVEVFNVFNHPNFYPVSTTFGAATFGTVGTALDSRQAQLGVKYNF